MGDKTFRDSFSKAFINYGDMRTFLHERNPQWPREQAKRLKFVALRDEEPYTQQMKEYYTQLGYEDIFNDTFENTRLFMQTQDSAFPVRDCALKTIFDRARIGGAALSRVGKPELAEILNRCMQVARGDALILYVDGKVSAVHGGDKNDYAILPMAELFEATLAYLEENYPGVEFGGGWFSHTTVTAVWQLHGHEDMLQVYQDALDAAGRDERRFCPALRLITSDIGASGANLVPMLTWDEGNRSLSLGSVIRLEHRRGATIEKFKELLGGVYAQYTVALKGLSALLEIDIINPANTMQGVMKRLDFGKRLTFKAIELFKHQYGDSPCTAHDIFFGINEVVAMAQAEGAGGHRIAQLEEMVARAYTVRWHEYDIPGEIPW